MTTQHFTPEVSDDLVRLHEQYLVPAIYAQWAARVAEISEIDVGHHVLDVACGTGTLARALGRLGSERSFVVHGSDGPDTAAVEIAFFFPDGVCERTR